MSDHRLTATLAATLAVFLAAGSAAAQSMSSTSASYNAGYGRNPGDESRAVDPGTRDANGNRVIIDGIIQTGAGASAYARADSFGVGFSGTGTGGGSMVGGATAIGNNLVVITQGNYNVVIVDSTQINNGDISADADLNGEVDLDDGQP